MSAEAKTAKKLAKAAAKAAKKGGAVSATAGNTAAPAAGSNGELTPAERAAAAAEKQVRLQHWRVILAGVSVLVGLITLLIMWARQ